MNAPQTVADKWLGARQITLPGAATPDTGPAICPNCQPFYNWWCNTIGKLSEHSSDIAINVAKADLQDKYHACYQMLPSVCRHTFDAHSGGELCLHMLYHQAYLELHSLATVITPPRFKEPPPPPAPRPIIQLEASPLSMGLISEEDVGEQQELEQVMQQLAQQQQ